METPDDEPCSSSSTATLTPSRAGHVHKHKHKHDHDHVSPESIYRSNKSLSHSRTPSDGSPLPLRPSQNLITKLPPHLRDKSTGLINESDVDYQSSKNKSPVSLDSLNNAAAAGTTGHSEGHLASPIYKPSPQLAHGTPRYRLSSLHLSPILQPSSSAQHLQYHRPLSRQTSSSYLNSSKSTTQANISRVNQSNHLCYGNSATFSFSTLSASSTPSSSSSASPVHISNASHYFQDHHDTLEHPTLQSPQVNPNLPADSKDTVTSPASDISTETSHTLSSHNAPNQTSQGNSYNNSINSSRSGSRNSGMSTEKETENTTFFDIHTPSERPEYRDRTAFKANLFPTHQKLQQAHTFETARDRRNKHDLDGAKMNLNLESKSDPNLDSKETMSTQNLTSYSTVSSIPVSQMRNRSHDPGLNRIGSMNNLPNMGISVNVYNNLYTQFQQPPSQTLQLQSHTNGIHYPSHSRHSSESYTTPRLESIPSELSLNTSTFENSAFQNFIPVQSTEGLQIQNVQNSVQALAYRPEHVKSKRSLFSVISFQILWIIGALIDVLVDVILFWNLKIKDYFTKSDDLTVLNKEIRVADSYEEWEAIAYRMDSILGNDLWRQNPNSKKYDCKLISSRLKQLVEAREEENTNELIISLRSGLLRNLGSLCNMDLFNRAYSGTKFLIEDYISEVVRCLEYLETREMNDFHVVDSKSTSFATHQQKLDFFHDTRQSFGRSALVLHGGSLFGLCHLGVVKALFLNGLLPRIISGATVGALVAALVCSFSDDELLTILDGISQEMPTNFSANISDIKFYSNVERILRSLYPPEIILFEQYVRNKIGDITFEEAYVKSDRALNITITPSDTSMPKLLNYLTTPHVVIWSAVNASIGTGVLYSDVELLAKDHLGNIVPYASLMLPKETSTRYSNPKADKYSMEPSTSTVSHNRKIFYKPSNLAMYSDRDSPYTKMSELFNVNNFTVSSARPYLAPLLAGENNYRGYGGILPRLSRVFKLEVQHRLWQFARMNLLPEILQRVFVDEKIPHGGGLELTIVPELPSLLRDLGKVFDSQDIPTKIDYMVKVGERSVWPNLQVIWARCAVEFVLDDLYQLARKGSSRR